MASLQEQALNVKTKKNLHKLMRKIMKHDPDMFLSEWWGATMYAFGLDVKEPELGPSGNIVCPCCGNVDSKVKTAHGISSFPNIKELDDLSSWRSHEPDSMRFVEHSIANFSDSEQPYRYSDIIYMDCHECDYQWLIPAMAERIMSMPITSIPSRLK